MDETKQRAQARIGKVLRDRYRIDALLGAGGMALVYVATHRNKKRFAIKMLHPELALNAEAKQRFVREGYVANTVDHPGAVAVLDDDVTEDGAPFLVMELLDGAEVGELAEKRGNVLPPSLVLAIVDQALGVLDAAHKKGIVHRDLKPANLFVTRDGTVKVLDFGIAHVKSTVTLGGASLTQTGALMGTPAFLSPEQAGGRTREVDHQSDLWALGATMFTLLSGRFVHEAENAVQIMVLAATQPARSLATVMPGAPPALVQLVDRALAFDKTTRWPDAPTMRAATREAYRALTGGGVPTREVLAEIFGIGTWETSYAEILQPPPGVSGPLPNLASSPSHGTAPMPIAPRQPRPTTPMPSAPTVATAHPVEAPIHVPMKSNRGVMLLLLAVAAVACGLSVAGYAALRGRRAPAQIETASASVAAPPASLVVLSAAPTPSASAPPPPATTTTSPSSAPVVTHAAPLPSAQPSAKPRPSDSGDPCIQHWYDALGNDHFKNVCK